MMLFITQYPTSTVSVVIECGDFRLYLTVRSQECQLSHEVNESEDNEEVLSRALLSESVYMDRQYLPLSASLVPYWVEDE
ncbi:unnamed protein product [Didymodactylos carnosus]|uniref:Uncharacterized protein n=1 Tax=Didymodactylos carnosus TaxID=1234261 RepID=A0A8S2D4M6_9BILA|nr:unnamed protein product [Didymodactylos carnosus]CAF3595956.1 unnamed protein product [Didymodactylos carnosus]